MYDSPIRMQMSAMRAAGPSLEMFRMKARGMSTATWIAMRALVESGLSPPSVTASERFTSQRYSRKFWPMKG